MKLAWLNIRLDSKWVCGRMIAQAASITTGITAIIYAIGTKRAISTMGEREIGVMKPEGLSLPAVSGALVKNVRA